MSWRDGSVVRSPKGDAIDWRGLAARHDAAPHVEVDGLAAALARAAVDPDARRAALDADPLFLFRDLAEADTRGPVGGSAEDDAEVHAMRRAVADLRRASEIARASDRDDAGRGDETSRVARPLRAAAAVAGLAAVGWLASPESQRTQELRDAAERPSSLVAEAASLAPASLSLAASSDATLAPSVAFAENPAATSLEAAAWPDTVDTAAIFADGAALASQAVAAGGTVLAVVDPATVPLVEDLSSGRPLMQVEDDALSLVVLVQNDP
ncbi:MAG: hypothetical protein AAGN46_10670 [Acidobacteriota bacterium]